MFRKLSNLLFPIALLSLSACTTTGNPSIADESRDSVSEKLREGVTSKQEVATLLGDPSEATFIVDGKEMWTYEMAKITPLPTNYIPYVGVLMRGSDRVDQKLIILFDHSSIVEKYTWTESKSETRTGVLVKPIASAAGR